MANIITKPLNNLVYRRVHTQTKMMGKKDEYPLAVSNKEANEETSLDYVRWKKTDGPDEILFEYLGEIEKKTLFLNDPKRQTLISKL